MKVHEDDLVMLLNAGECLAELLSAPDVIRGLVIAVFETDQLHNQLTDFLVGKLKQQFGIQNAQRIFIVGPNLEDQHALTFMQPAPHRYTIALSRRCDFVECMRFWHGVHVHFTSLVVNVQRYSSRVTWQSVAV